MSRRERALTTWLTIAVAIGGTVAVRSPTNPKSIASAFLAQPFDTARWKTDFNRHSVPLTEIMSGGPPKDGIPAIDKPEFVSASSADLWLRPREPVILFESSGAARAYPLQILIWHEIANDTVAGKPVAITFCPLCHTAIAFDRRVAGRVLDFGTTGKLRFSDLVMYDRPTESWWQQATGEAIVGTLTGSRLTPLPAQIVSWDTFKRAFPNGEVLSRRTGRTRAYGQNPYAGYDDIDAAPFLYSGPKDPRLRPMERVVTVSIGADDVAYPFSALERVHVINDTVGGRAVTVFFGNGVTSVLDRPSIAASREIGMAGVFDRTINGTILTFMWAGGEIVDRKTRSTMPGGPDRWWSNGGRSRMNMAKDGTLLA